MYICKQRKIGEKLIFETYIIFWRNNKSNKNINYNQKVLLYDNLERSDLYVIRINNSYSQEQRCYNGTTYMDSFLYFIR